MNNQTRPERYSAETLGQLASAKIPASLSSRLNLLKSQNPEAFFYWVKTAELMK